MSDLQTSDIRAQEHGNAVIVVLIVLVLVAVGAIAYLSGNIGMDAGNKDASAQAAAAEPASAEQAQPVQAADANQAPAIEIKPGNPVVAKVNDTDISRIDVFQFIQTMGANTQQLPIEQLFPLALDQLISSQVINAKADAVNLDNDPLVKQQLEAAKAQIVRGVFVQREVEKGITDERLKLAYDQYVTNFPEIPEVKTRHILVKEEAEAKDVLAKLAEGADFAELAKEVSIDATKENGGELGYMSKQDQVIPEYLEAVFAMEPGEVSKEAVKSQFGYHIIEVQDARNRPAPPFESQQVKDFLSAQLRNAVLNEIVNEWREDAGVSIFDINGDPIEPAAGEEAAPAQEEAPATE